MKGAGAYARVCDAFHELKSDFHRFIKKEYMTELASLNVENAHDPIVELLAAIASLDAHVKAQFPVAESGDEAGRRGSVAGHHHPRRRVAARDAPAERRQQNVALAASLRGKQALKAMFLDSGKDSFMHKWGFDKPRTARAGQERTTLAWHLGLQLPSDAALEELAERLKSENLTDDKVTHVSHAAGPVVKFLRCLADFRARRALAVAACFRVAHDAREARDAAAARDALPRGARARAGARATASRPRSRPRSSTRRSRRATRRCRRIATTRTARRAASSSIARCATSARSRRASARTRARAEEAREEEARGGGADGARAAPFVEDCRTIWELENGVLRAQVVGQPRAVVEGGVLRTVWVGGPLARYALRLVGAWTPAAGVAAEHDAAAAGGGGAAGAAVVARPLERLEAPPLEATATCLAHFAVERFADASSGDGDDDGDGDAHARAHWARPLVNALEQVSENVPSPRRTFPLLTRARALEQDRARRRRRRRARASGARAAPAAPAVPWGAARMVLIALRVVACRREGAADAAPPRWWRELANDDGDAGEPSRLVAALVALLERAERDARAEAKAEASARGGRDARDASAAAAAAAADDDDDNEQGEGAERVRRESARSRPRACSRSRSTAPRARPRARARARRPRARSSRGCAAAALRGAAARPTAPPRTTQLSTATSPSARRAAARACRSTSPRCARSPPRAARGARARSRRRGSSARARTRARRARRPCSRRPTRPRASSSARGSRPRCARASSRSRARAARPRARATRRCGRRPRARRRRSTRSRSAAAPRATRSPTCPR